MLVPIRCFTCGSLVADKEDDFQSKVRAGEDAGKILTELGVERYCCRRMLLSNSNIIDQVVPYYESLAEKKSEFMNE